MPGKSSRPSGFRRKGIAVTASGRSTVFQIVEAARQILIAPAGGELTLRKVAARCGRRLANVQYYFNSRERLVEALIADTGARYQRAYDHLLNEITEPPEARFRAIVRFNIEDSFDPGTRALFIKFWALLEELDRPSGRLLADLYKVNIEQLSQSLSAVYPDERPSEIRGRSALISALTEGLMVAAGSGALSPRDRGHMIELSFQAAMHIAAGGATRHD